MVVSRLQLTPFEELDDLRRYVADLESRLSRQDEDGRRTAEELFRKMADAAPFMMWMAGTDGRCTFFNRGWLQFRGRSMTQELGYGWAEGVHPEDLQSCLTTYRTSFENRREFHMEYRLMNSRGKYRAIVDTGLPNYRPDGTFAGYLGSCIEAGSGPDLSAAQGEGAAAGASEVALTNREKQVLILIALGYSTKKAAAQLGISYKTADSHRTKIMDKLGVHETASLVRYAIRQRLVPA